MELSNRLKAICDLCDRGNTVADIGCDHGYVSITLVNKGIFDKALAMDINEGPLRLASQNIQLYGDSSRIETRLSSGLDKLECGEGLRCCDGDFNRWDGSEIGFVGDGCEVG